MVKIGLINKFSIFLLLAFFCLPANTNDKPKIENKTIKKSNEEKLIEALRKWDSPQEKDVELVKRLIRKVNINYIDKNGSSALSLAIALPVPEEIVDLILSTPNINVNSQNEHGWTVLMTAIMFSGSGNVNKLLKMQGIDLSIRDIETGLTALGLARQYAKFESDSANNCINDDSRKVELITKYLLNLNLNPELYV